MLHFKRHCAAYSQKMPLLSAYATRSQIGADRFENARQYANVTDADTRLIIASLQSSVARK